MTSATWGESEWWICCQIDFIGPEWPLLSVTDASILGVDHKSSNGEHPGYPSTTVSTLGLSNNWGNVAWKGCSHVNSYWSFYVEHTGSGRYNPSFAGSICSPLWPTREHSLRSMLEFCKWPHYQSYESWKKYKNCVLALTICKWMGNVNGWIIH